MTNKNPKIGQIERKTQDRVVQFFHDVLKYDYLGNWETRENSNIEEEYLVKFLKNKQKYSDELIKKAIFELNKVATNQQKSLYDINKEIYGMLRYGIPIKENLSKPSKHIHFIDWKNPINNNFAIAEEVTIRGKHTKRPDIVLYINGIALGVIELKRSKISISEGIRQNLDNQKKEFIEQFFATQQFVMSGNDTQGLSYGTIGTSEKYYLNWKEENPDFSHNNKQNISRILSTGDCGKSKNILDCDIYRLLNKERFLELIHDFIVFDAGVKKVCRHNQYFAVKETQKSLKQREGGIIWHTQGSGKSLTMVWIAKWIRENVNDSRVLIITDRTELDEQIEKVFKGVHESIYRTKSGRDLLTQLNKKDNSLIASLVHKFGRGESSKDQNYKEYITEIKKNLPSNFEAKGDIYVFVDECHRTQSGKLHKAMQEILPNAVFLGFTGTPLLKKDKSTTIETFGKYIHTYKFDEAIDDEVVLDLRYEARKIDQKVSAQDKIDVWFKAKTKGLSDLAIFELKKKWGTMQKVLSSKSRLEKIVADILFDFETKPRLEEGRGNAMLVAGSIYEACKYYELFVEAGFNKCAIVTSYTPDVASIKGESDGEDQRSENIKKYEVYRKMIANFFDIKEDDIRDRHIEDFEKETKRKFINEPGQMKLLIVVDKLLTGFDAPSATYLYIDKSMQDHGLFQAVCRVNRLDDKDKGDELDKDYGYIIDYKDLFKSVEEAIDNYTSGAFDSFDKDDVGGLLKNRLEEGRNKLDEVLEQVKALVEGVQSPKSINEYKVYFLGDDPREKEQLRLEFYKKVASLIRAYTNIANEMEEAGYSNEQEGEIKKDVSYFSDLRDELKLMSGDYLDLKRFNPAMRHLIDSYIQAEDSKKISAFENISLLEIIVKQGIEKAIEKLPKAIGKEKNAIAETIENNVRKLITDERAVNPKYFEKMSIILDELIKKRKEEVFSYEEYLKNITNLVNKVMKKEDLNNKYPHLIRSSEARKALYDNLDNNDDLAIKLDEVIIKTKKDNFRGSKLKQREVRNAIMKVFDENEVKYDDEYLDNIFNIVIEQNEY